MALPDHRTRKPEWLKVQAFSGAKYSHVNGLLKDLGLRTVCQEANCPNRGECYNRGTAVFLIMGPNCTRNCRFCDVRPGIPSQLDPSEPKRVAEAAASLALRHVVVTSVTRDDLPDGGAEHFASAIRELRLVLPTSTIEVLTPDFRGNLEAVHTVMGESPHVFNHNLETVPRLYSKVRPGADYRRSLTVLSEVRDYPKILGKSGLMVGLGETRKELQAVFSNLAAVGVSLLTIGQYLSPSAEHLPVIRYLPPEEFHELRELAIAEGIPTVFSGPLVRSSYLADSLIAGI